MFLSRVFADGISHVPKRKNRVEAQKTCVCVCGWWEANETSSLEMGLKRKKS